MDSHRHAWSVAGFALDGDRPVMHQRCACGAERSVPAWDRTWTPPRRWRLVPDADELLRGRLMTASEPLAAAGEGITVDVWSDIACPWCYIGKRNLEAGIAVDGAGASAGPVVVRYHSFELDPDAPDAFDGSAAEYLARRKGIDLADAQRMHERVTAVAAAAGLRYDFASVRPVRTARAHQLVHLARGAGREGDAVERLFAAHFTQGRNVGDVEELVTIGAELGLAADAVRRALAGDELLAAVRDDEQQAAAIGINGVPFYVLDGRYGLSGAQPPEVFAAALRRVAAERTGASTAW